MPGNTVYIPMLKPGPIVQNKNNCMESEEFPGPCLFIPGISEARHCESDGSELGYPR